MTFFSRHRLLHDQVRHILPPTTFLCDLPGAPHQIQPHFSPIQTKMPRQIFLVALGGAPAPLHPLDTPINPITMPNHHIGLPLPLTARISHCGQDSQELSHNGYICLQL